MKGPNEIKAEIEIATRLDMEYMFRIWLNLAKSKVQQKLIFYFNFRAYIHYDLSVAFWEILEVAYKEICEGIA